MSQEFLQKYAACMGEMDRAGRCLGQDRLEWLAFLEYAAAYFRNRGIEHPVVVEIGTLDGAQKRFYEDLLGAEHIGVSLPQNSSAQADIVGDSTKPATLAALEARLNGRPIDLLFIDGNHVYEYAKSDYETYGPLTRHLIALHDIACFDVPECVDVLRYWRELCEMEGHLHISFHKKRTHEVTTIWPGHEMGIGLVVKGGAL